MTNPLFPPFNLADLIEAKASNKGYTFTFDTDQVSDLGMSEADQRFVISGYVYNLKALAKVRRPLVTTPQVAALYDASNHVDHLLIAYDQGTQQITGTWPGV